MYVLKEIAKIWTVFNLLQCIFGLFRSALNTYNLKSLLGPNITLAKIITSGFFGVFSQTIFHVLQSDSTQNKPPSPKRRRRHSISSCNPHSHNELNLLHKKFENFFKKSSSPAHNNSNEHNTSPLLNSIYQCYETPNDSRTKADFQSLHLHSFRPNKRSRGISLSRDLFENDSDYQEIPKDLLFNLPPTLTSTVPTPQESQPPIPQTHVPSWADEVQQCGHSTPETVVSNWANTLAGSVDHEHAQSHWCTHHQSCRHLTHNAHPYPHRGSGPPSLLSGHTSFSHNHPMIGLPPQIIILH